MALAKPNASVPPWLLMAMPLRPEERPAVEAARVHALLQGAQARFCASNAPSLAASELVKASRIQAAICLAVPSAVLSAMLPAKPSTTTTSTTPWPIWSPSMKPR